MAVTNQEQRKASLLGWYATHGRKFPWRVNSDPWSVLVSEIMLQQTQAPRVVPFFEDFLARYPSPAALAIAPPAEVLAAWSGLGYNRRAIRLQEAARHIAAEGWPSDPNELENLPGIGRYTAAAVACFAFGAQLPTVETNLRRVLNRWYGRALTGDDLTKAARRELPPERAADWNQAVMDLGATLCKPREPRCSHCPVVEWCAGPETYVSPPAQPRFGGSSREARGAVIRTLVKQGPATVRQLSTETDLDPSRLQKALEALVAEGMVEPADSGAYRLPGS